MRTKLYSMLAASLLLVLLMIPFVAFAQNGETISYDQVVTGQITNDAPEVRYAFQGSAGDVIVISMSATESGLDSFLRLLGPDGAELMVDDDSGSYLNSLIGPYAIPADGVYTIVATRCCGGFGGSSGTYELVVMQPEITALVVDEPVTLTLSQAVPRRFLVFAAGVTGVYAAQAVKLSGEGGFEIQARGADGRYLSMTYGQPEGSVSLDPLFVGDEDIIFTVRREVIFGEGGPVEPEGELSIQLTLKPVETQPIVLNQAVSGLLSNDNPTDYYTFRASADDLLRLTGSQSFQEGSHPFEVRMFSPAGMFFNGISVDFYREVYEFTLDPLQFDALDDGEYLLVVNRFDQTGEGLHGTADYSILVSESLTVALQPGVAVRDTVGGPDVYEKVYAYSGQAGQTVRITVLSESDTYGPSFFGQGPATVDGGDTRSVFTFNGNAAAPGTISQEFVLPASGWYVVRVSNALFDTQGSLIGDFSLMVEIVE
jgi:hypothetical protein